MRSLSASISLWLAPARVSLPGLALFLLLCLVGCASNLPSIIPVEEQAELIGTVTISGEHPYERQLILADTSGVYWLIESSEYEGELLKLGGQSIRALGIARTEESGYRSLLLRWYDLHPEPGCISGVGMLERWNGDLVLVSPHQGRSEQGQRVLIIEGPLRSVLEIHIGYRVWITGESVRAPGNDDVLNLAAEQDEIDGGETGQDLADPETGRPAGNEDPSARLSLIRVVALEYGVLGPPIPSREAFPHSILQDSSRR